MLSRFLKVIKFRMISEPPVHFNGVLVDLLDGFLCRFHFSGIRDFSCFVSTTNATILLGVIIVVDDMPESNKRYM